MASYISWRYPISLCPVLLLWHSLFFASSTLANTRSLITHSRPPTLLNRQRDETLTVKYITEVKGVYYLVVGHILTDGRVIVLQRHKLRYFKPEAWRAQDRYTVELVPKIEALAASHEGRWLASSMTMIKPNGEPFRTLYIDDLKKRTSVHINLDLLNLDPLSVAVKSLRNVGHGFPELIVERPITPMVPDKPSVVLETLVPGTITKGLLRYIPRQTTSMQKLATQQAIIQVEHKVIDAVVKAKYTPYPTVREGSFWRTERTDHLAIIAYRKSDATGLVRVVDLEGRSELEGRELFVAVQNGISLGTITYPSGQDIRRAFVGNYFVLLVDQNFKVANRIIEVWSTHPLKCITRITAVELVSAE